MRKIICLSIIFNYWLGRLWKVKLSLLILIYWSLLISNNTSTRLNALLGPLLSEILIVMWNYLLDIIFWKICLEDSYLAERDILFLIRIGLHAVTEWPCGVIILLHSIIKVGLSQYFRPIFAATTPTPSTTIIIHSQIVGAFQNYVCGMITKRRELFLWGEVLGLPSLRRCDMTNRTKTCTTCTGNEW